MIDSPWLDGRDRNRYERTMEGWVDNAYDHAFTHTVQIGDDRLRVELSADCTPSPVYEVLAARARVFSDDAALTTAGRFEELAGARMIGGFTRRLTEVAGSGPASRFLVDAGIEVARLARQAAKLPREATAHLGVGRGSCLLGARQRKLDRSARILLHL
jgi:hypothetical protein